MMSILMFQQEVDLHEWRGEGRVQQQRGRGQEDHRVQDRAGGGGQEGDHHHSEDHHSAAAADQNCWQHQERITLASFVDTLCMFVGCLSI